MTVVKKTVAINPIMDDYIRKTWAIFIENGIDATYSTAVNYMLLGHIQNTINGKLKKSVVETLSSFLNDKKILRDLNLEDYGNNTDKIFDEKDRERGKLK